MDFLCASLAGSKSSMSSISHRGTQLGFAFRLHIRKNTKALTPRRDLYSFERNAAGSEHRTVKHNFVTHISRHQESVEQFIAGCSHHEQKPKKQTLHEIPEETLFSFKTFSSITPRAYTPKAHAVQTLQRCGVGKDLQRMLVDRNYQIEQGESQQRSKQHNIHSSFTLATEIRLFRRILESRVVWHTVFFFLSFTVRTHLNVNRGPLS